MKKVILFLITICLILIYSSFVSADNFTVTHDDVFDQKVEENTIGFYCFGMNETLFLQNVTFHSLVSLNTSDVRAVVWNTTDHCAGGAGKVPQPMGKHSVVSFNSSVTSTAFFDNKILLVEGQSYIVGVGRALGGSGDLYNAFRESSPVRPTTRPELTWLGGGVISQANFPGTNTTSGDGYLTPTSPYVIELGLSNATIVDPPIISAINFVSDIPGKTCPSWTSINNCTGTNDQTPSFTVTVDKDGSCRMATSDVSYTAMNITMAGSNTTFNHTGAFPNNFTLGNHTAYFGCTDGSGNANEAPLPTANKANFRIFKKFIDIAKSDVQILLSGIKVHLFNQLKDFFLVGNKSSNGTGETEFHIFDSGDYWVCVYDPGNSSRDGDSDPHINVPN